MAVPDFFVIGAPKAGTTALHDALRAHPGLFMSAVKEPKYFLAGDVPPSRQRGPGDAHSAQEWVWRQDEYEALFEGAPAGTLKGESTPFYLSDRAAHQRIAAAVPDARLIAVLRDPVDRAYSNWAHLWADGLEPVGDFIAACGQESERHAEGWSAFWRYRWLGRYGEQLEHLFSVFPREQVHLLRYRELVDEPAKTLDLICTFLGVEPGVVAEVPARNVSTYVHPSLTTRTLQAAIRAGAAVGQHFPPVLWRKTSAPLLAALKRSQRDRPELSAEQRASLLPYFTDDIGLLEEVTGSSYQDWRSDRDRGTFSMRSSRAS